MENLTVSVLPSITFYSGEDAIECATAVENRDYGHYSDYFGYLYKTNDGNSYWSNMTSSIFSENPTNYSNIGDIIQSTISYMNNFKGNSLDISINKNVLTFNYDFENDLDSLYDNTYIRPASDIIDLLLNVNEMTFNKQNYYHGNIELKEISYAHKKYPYRPDGTVYDVNDPEDDTKIIHYDFSKKFVDYNYAETSYDIAYIGWYMREIILEDGTISYVPTERSYTGFNTYYTYLISDVNDFSVRMDKFFEDNSDYVESEFGDLKTYFISELDTVLTISLNTNSLGNKNLYAYFNFNSDFNNWYNNVFSMTLNTTGLAVDDNLAKITPVEESWFNINMNSTAHPCGEDRKISEATDFAILNVDDLQEVQKFEFVNPSKIKELDLSSVSDKLDSIDFISNYEKRIDKFTHETTNWINENSLSMETLKIGNLSKQGTVEYLHGISNLNTLKNIDLTNCNNLKKDFSIAKMNYLETFLAQGSNIKTFVPRRGVHFTNVVLPNTLNTLSLKNNTFDNFEYTPNGNLINLTLENVSGIDTKSLVKTWVDALETTMVTGDNGNPISMLLQGIITNTNITGINWENYPVADLLKFKYLGLNKFSGEINTIGTADNDNLTRHEYIDLRKTFGDDMTINKTADMVINYNLDPMAFKKTAYFYSIDTETFEGITTEIMIPEQGDFTFNINDNDGGYSLLDYFDSIERIELTKNKDKFGYEVDLPVNIYTNNKDKQSLTRNIAAGDVLLYKGNRLILVYRTPVNITGTNYNVVYNYVKLGKFVITNQSYDKIVIGFKELM